MSGSVKVVNDFLLSLGLNIKKIDIDMLTALFERMTVALPLINNLTEISANAKPQVIKSLEKACRVTQRACTAIAPSFLAAECVYEAYCAAEVENISASISSSPGRSRSATASTLRRWALEITSNSDIHSANREADRVPPSVAGRSRNVADWMVPLYHSLALCYQPSAWLPPGQITAMPGQKSDVINPACIQNVSQLMLATVQHIALRGSAISVLNSAMHNAVSYLNVNQQPCRNVSSTTSVQQQNTYHIYGSNALEIASEVEVRQHSANARIMRANQNGVG